MLLGVRLTEIRPVWTHRRTITSNITLSARHIRRLWKRGEAPLEFNTKFRVLEQSFCTDRPTGG